MITLLIGENTFEIEQAVRAIAATFNGTPEHVDGGELELRQIPDLLMGGTLFADKRLVIIKGLSDNKTVWVNFADWLPRVSDDIELVLVELKPDKRTTTFKELKKVAIVKEFDTWTDRDISKAEAWVSKQAEVLNVVLNKKSVQYLVQRVGVDQWQLFHALQKLALVDNVTDEVIEDVIEANPVENVFALFETALRGDSKKIVEIIRTLELSEEPYKLFGLLSSQVFQLAAVASAESGDTPSKDFAIHPYVLSKLSTSTKKLGKSQIAKMVRIFAETDDDMKLSKADPWLLVERALIKVSSI